MTNETMEKVIEIHKNLTWCEQVIEKKDDKYTFTIGVKRDNSEVSNGQYTLACPDWLKNNIVKLAEKYKEKLTAQLSEL